MGTQRQKQLPHRPLMKSHQESSKPSHVHNSIQARCQGLEKWLGGLEHRLRLQRTQVQFPAIASGSLQLPATPDLHRLCSHVHKLTHRHTKIHTVLKYRHKKNFNVKNQSQNNRSAEMVQQLRARAALPEDLGFMPRIRVVAQNHL